MWRQPSWLTVSRGFQPGGPTLETETAQKIFQRLEVCSVLPGGWKPALTGRQGCLPPHSHFLKNSHHTSTSIGSMKGSVNFRM